MPDIPSFSEFSANLPKLSLDDLTSRIKGLGFDIASTTQGRHNVGSAHYSGRAADVRIVGKSPEQISKLMSSLSTAGYKVIDERQRLPNEKVWGGPHIHVQFQGDTVKLQTPPSFSEFEGKGIPSFSEFTGKTVPLPTPKPLSKADQRAAYYDQGSAARKGDLKLDDLARNIEWHFGYSTLQAFSKLPEDQRKQIAQKATQFAAIDEERKKSGYKPVRSTAWQEENRRRVGLVLPEVMSPQEEAVQQAQMGDAERIRRTNPLLKLSSTKWSDLLGPISNRWLVDTLATGGAGVMEFVAGAEELATKSPLSIAGRFGIPGAKGAAEREAAGLRENARQIRQISKEAEEAVPTTGASQFVKGLASSAIEYAPMALLPEAGIEGALEKVALSMASFGGYSGIQAVGRGESERGVAKETGVGMLLGAPFGVPLPKKNLLTKAISNLVITGGGTTLVNRATGQPWSDSAAQGLAIAVLRSPELLHGLKVQDSNGSVRPATVTDLLAHPEVEKAIAKVESRSANAPLDPRAPQLASTRLRELNQAILKAENDLRLVKQAKGRTNKSTKLENTIVKRITDLTRERNQFLDSKVASLLEGTSQRKTFKQRREVGPQIPPLTKATENIASRIPEALEDPTHPLAPGGVAEQLGATPEQIRDMRLGTSPEQRRLMQRVQAAPKGQGVLVIPDVQATSVKVTDPVVGDVDVPIWQVLGDQRGFLNLGDIAAAVDELRKKYPGLSEASYRALAINRMKAEKAAGEHGSWQPGQHPEVAETHRKELQSLYGTTPQPTSRDQLIKDIRLFNPAQNEGTLTDRLPPGQYEYVNVPVKDLSSPYTQPVPNPMARYGGTRSPQPTPIVVNDHGEVVAGQHRYKLAQDNEAEMVKVWKPAGVEVRAPEFVSDKEANIQNYKDAIARTQNPKEKAYYQRLLDEAEGQGKPKPGVQVVKRGVPEVSRETSKPATAAPKAEAKSTGTTEPGTERYVLGVQKGKDGWYWHVRDTQFPDQSVHAGGPVATRDAAIQQGGFQTTRLNRSDEAGFVNVGDAFDAVKDFFEGLPRGVDKDLWAATLKALQSHEGAQAGLDVQKLNTLDRTFEAAEVAANRLPKQILKDLMVVRSRGLEETLDGKRIYREAYQRLAQIKQPYLRDQVAKLSRAAQESYDLVHKYAIARGVDLAYRENYFRGLWKQGDAAKADSVMQQWGTTEGYKKRKAILTVADGMGYGLELDNYNPFTNARQELIAIERREAMKDLAKHITTLPGVGVEAKTLSHDDLMRLRAQGWSFMKDSAFEGVLVAPEYAKYLNKMMGANFMSGKRPLRAMREISRTLQKAKFVGSIFHFKNMVKASIAAETGGMLNPAGYVDVYKAMRASPAFSTGLDLKAAGIDPHGAAHADYITRSGGYKRAMETEGARAFGQELNVLLERALTPRIGEAGAKIGKAVRDVSTMLPGAPGFQRWQFNKFIPVLKEIKYFRDLASEEAAKGRKLTGPEKTDIIKRNQNFYGEMNEQLLNRGRGMTSALRIPFTAPGFGEGNIRTMVRALAEPIGAVGKLARGEKLTKMDIRSATFMINSWVMSALAAQAATRILTGKWATPRNIREMFLFNTGDVDKDGAPIYFDMLSYDKDYWTMLGFMMNVAGTPKSLKQKMGVQPTPYKASAEVLQRVAGAESPAFGTFGMLTDLIMHRQIYDWRNRPLLEEGDVFSQHNLKAIGDQAVDRFEPIMISTIRQAVSAGMPTGKSVIYSTFGVRPVKLPGIYQLAHDFNVAHKHPPTGVFEASKYQDMTDSLGRPEMQTAYNDLHKTEGAGKILEYYKNRTTRPLTGNKDREAEFIKTLTLEQLEWYNTEYAKRKRDLQYIEQLTGLSVPLKPVPPAQTAKKPSIYQTP